MSFQMVMLLPTIISANIRKTVQLEKRSSPTCSDGGGGIDAYDYWEERLATFTQII